MYILAHKNHLGRNLMKMLKLFPNDYNFFPHTWLLPSELNEFKKNFDAQGKSHSAFIFKPEADCQGRGIFLAKNINKYLKKEQQNYVAQRYLDKPYLIDGLKFDFRIYILVYGLDPLRIYIFKEGLTRLATEQYEKPTKKNMKNLF